MYNDDRCGSLCSGSSALEGQTLSYDYSTTLGHNRRSQTVLEHTYIIDVIEVELPESFDTHMLQPILLPSVNAILLLTLINYIGTTKTRFLSFLTGFLKASARTIACYYDDFA